MRCRPALAPSVRRASPFGSCLGVENVLVAVAVVPPPLARWVSCPAQASLSLGLRAADGIAPARRPGVADIAVVGERPVWIDRRPEAEPCKSAIVAPTFATGS